MKETEKPNEAKAAAVQQPAPAAAVHMIRLGMPIVYKAPKKKNKRKYTSGLKGIQKLGRAMTRGSERLTDGLDRGFSSFRSRTNSSSKKKRDGAIVDSVKNFTKGVGKSLRTASKAPNDVVKGVNTKFASRQVRRVVRTITRPVFG